ncbi:MAG: helix-turn-helix domain-containing protein [Planctomycetales bacterium]|nr:helix-turn-helix domain-containing protein [Planctomycetales bacterium]
MKDENLKKLKGVYDLDAMLTTQDVADLLKVSERHVRNLIKSRQLPQPLKFGRNARFRRSDISRILNGDVDEGLRNQAI